MNRSALAALLTGAAGVLAGCGAAGVGVGPTGAQSAPSITVGTTPAQVQVLARSLDDTPRSLDPQIANDVPSQRVLDDLFEGLTTIDLAGNASAGVATSWESSADGRTWTFHLRPEARWSNGAPLTAQDFVYSWRREVDPKTGAEYAQALSPIENALDIAEGRKPIDTLGVEALDAQTLRVRLTGPTPYLLDLLCQPYLYPVYQPAIQKYGDSWARPEHIVSNGAFMLQEDVIGSRITLAKNPNYWDAARVRLQRVVYYILTDQSVQAQRFLAGDVDWTDSFAANQRAWLKSQLGDQVVNSPYFGTYMLGINVQRPPFKNNRALRQALVLALDREPLTGYLREGMNPPAYTLMPPLPGYQRPRPAWLSLSTAQRHARARELYRAAGYSSRHPLRVDLDVPIGGSDQRDLYEAIVADWRSVLGADVQLHELEFKVLLQELQLHNFVLFHSSWIGDYPDPFAFMQIFRTGDGNNYGSYSNPAFDQLLDQATQSADKAARYRLFEQAERLLDDDAAYIPIMYYTTRHLIKPYLRGWQSNIMDRNLSRYMYLLEHRGS